MSKSINRFLIEKGIKSNTQKITILQMVQWVEEWQEKVKNCSIPVVSISSITHVDMNDWAKEYAPDKTDGMKRLDFFNGALTLKQKLEGTADEC